MTKFICISARRHVGYVFILAIAVSAIIYLIMVNIVYSKVQMSYGRAGILKDYARLKINYELHRRDLGIKIQSEPSKVPQDRNVKLILLWTPLFEEWNFLRTGNDSFLNSTCPEARCDITSDRERLSESDAVLFHIRTLSMLDLPRNRTLRQKWIFFSLEAPPYSRFQGFEFMSGMFNWTMTYRKDSDVYIPYGRIVPKHTSNAFNYSDVRTKWKKKSKLAVWFVSHCSTDGNRENYIDQLKLYMDLDTYGSCGIGTCPFNKTNLCVQNFSKQYYFFLAFENAICDDYITEKLFRTLQYDMIPVVFGGGSYKAMAPLNSFINALEFKSPKHLSSHLLEVASNFTLFSKYFKWRHASYSEDIPNHCELCQKLHSEEFKKHSVYLDINEWWVKKSNCRRWKSRHV